MEFCLIKLMLLQYAASEIRLKCGEPEFSFWIPFDDKQHGFVAEIAHAIKKYYRLTGLLK